MEHFYSSLFNFFRRRDKWRGEICCLCELGSCWGGRTAVCAMNFTAYTFVDFNVHEYTDLIRGQISPPKYSLIHYYKQLSGTSLYNYGISILKLLLVFL